MRLLHRLRREHGASLTGRLFRGLVGPMIGLALLLGLGGAWAIHSTVEAVNDRLLGASARAVAETLEVEDGEITLDLPLWALGMLESTARDNIYYNVFAGRRLITGYPDLWPPDARTLDVQRTHFRYSEYRGRPVRIATEARRLPRIEDLVVVQVAETLDARRALTRHLLLQLIALEVALIAFASVLIPVGVRLGLAPLASLRRRMDARTASDFTPLPLADVPRELRDLVAAFNSLLERLDTATERMRRFTADASHQMRTPLSILRTHIGVLKQARLDTDEARQSIADIEAAADRLQRLLIQLLALARAEGADTFGLALKDIDMGAVSRAVAEEHAMQALRAGVDLRFVCDESRPLLARADDVLVKELLGNLVDNAVRYNNPGGTVTVRVSPSQAGVRVEVEDDGPGIPEEDRERVFTRFYRLHRDQDRTGSGLGLSIVRALAQVLNARITMTGGPDGRGLNVRIDFPGPHARPLSAHERDRLLTG